MWLENCFSVLTRSCFPRGPYTNTDGHSEPINYYTKKIATRSDTEYFRQVLTMYTHRIRSRQLFSAPINRDSNPRRRSSDLFLVGRRVSLELSIVSGYSCLPLLEIRVVVDFRESLRLDFQLSFLIHHFFFSKLFFLSLHKTRFGIFFYSQFFEIVPIFSSLLFSDTFHNFRFFFVFIRFTSIFVRSFLFCSSADKIIFKCVLWRVAWRRGYEDRGIRAAGGGDGRGVGGGKKLLYDRLSREFRTFLGALFE